MKPAIIAGGCLSSDCNVIIISKMIKTLLYVLMQIFFYKWFVKQLHTFHRVAEIYNACFEQLIVYDLLFINTNHLTLIKISKMNRLFRKKSLYWKKILSSLYFVIIIIFFIVVTGVKMCLFFVEKFSVGECGHHHHHHDEECHHHSCPSSYSEICSSNKCGCIRKYVLTYVMFSCIK